MKRMLLLLCLGLFVTPELWAQRPKAEAQPPKVEAQLRFDEARQEQVADNAAVAAADSLRAGVRFAFKLNRRRVTEAKAYDAVTLWNVRRVGIKERRMRLSDTTGRERVRLLKFFIEKSRKKGARPHLLGNVAGCMWNDHLSDSMTGAWGRKVSTHISGYTLSDEMAAARKQSAEVLFKVPRHLWRGLSHEAVYVLDGARVPSGVFFFAEGLILRTLDIYTDAQTMACYATDKGVVIGDLYPGGRLPLVVFNGAPSSIEAWLKMCHADAFAVSASVPMRYFYMLPVEAVQNYGVAGKYGAICIDIAE